MNTNDFLNRVIDDGIEACKQDYSKPKDALKLKGSIAGFEACRGKTPDQLIQLLTDARQKSQAAMFDKADNYWEIRCFDLEVEWVCNVLSAVLYNEGLPVIITPTARGMMKAAEIVGVAA